MPRKLGSSSIPFSSASSTSRSSRQKGDRKRKQRGLDAFAIASAEDPDRFRVKQHRLGEADTEPDRGQKRRRDDDDAEGAGEASSEASRRRQKKMKNASDDEDELNMSEGSDSEGNEWRMGHVDEDEDEDIDSDDAFGESDEEKFEGFSFRGSAQMQKKSRKKAKGFSESLDLNENQEDGEDDDSDSFGEDAVDLATMLDDDYASESVGSDDADIPPSTKAAKSSRTSRSSDDESEDGREEEDEEGGSSDSFDFSEEDEHENEEDDANRLEQLQDIISGLPRQASDDEDDEPAIDAQENRNRLLSALRGMANLDPALSKSAKKLTRSNDATQSGQNDKLVKTPLPKRQQDRIDRAVAYDKAKETLHRWIDTVKQNRRADHLSFPLADPDAQEAAGTTRLLQTGDGVPRNELEDAIQTILQESGLAVKGGQHAEEQVRRDEELRSQKMPLEELQARQAELRKRRDLLFREERRAKRISKIKSKAYRRVHRKERERLAEKERELLADAGLVDIEEERERSDRIRAEERMGGRHKESRWAKGMKASGRSTWDDEARSGITDMARRDEELRRRMEGRKIHNSDDDSVDLSDDSDDDDDDDNPGFQLRDALDGHDGASANETRLSSMAFMKRADAARKKQNDEAIKALKRDMGEQVEEDEEEEHDTSLGRRIFMPVSEKENEAQPSSAPRGELEEAESSDQDDEQPLVRAEPTEDTQAEQIPASRIDRMQQQQRPQPKGKLRRTSNKQLQVAGAVDTPSEAPASDDEADPIRPSDIVRRSNGRKDSDKGQEVRVKDDTNARNGQESDHSGEEVDDTLTPSNLALVEAAFGGEDVEAAFTREKKEAAEEEDDEFEDTFMPGWGSWAGQGQKKRRADPKRMVKKKSGVKAANRKDANLDRVILSEKRIKKNSKYLAPQLPHPFESKQQYERSLRVPVGPEWTTKETFQRSTKPRVITKQGIIRPMKKPLA